MMLGEDLCDDSASSSSFSPKVCFIGAGYVGGPTAAIIAHHCPHLQVMVLDLDEYRIRAWREGSSDKLNALTLPIYEPGLEQLILKTRGVNLQFSTDWRRELPEADVIFVSVNTPSKDGVEKVWCNGYARASEMCYLESAVRMVKEAFSKHSNVENGSHSKRRVIVVEKSTVPVGTWKLIKHELSSRQEIESHLPTFQILSNPEFMAEGTAIEDLQSPDRVLIGHEPGTDGSEAASALHSIYAHWVNPERIVTLDINTSELAKLASNALLAQRVSSINALSAMCEASGADVGQLAHALGMDHRLGPHFLQAGIGFGGSCFKKDLQSLVWHAEEWHLPHIAHFFEQILVINEWQPRHLVSKLKRCLWNSLKHKQITLLGWSFKPDTGDTRETSSALVCRELFREHVTRVVVHDPQVNPDRIASEIKAIQLETQHTHASTRVECNSVIDACRDADAMIICTGWEDYHNHLLDWHTIGQVMHQKIVFDGRRILDGQTMREFGFEYHSIGTASVVNRERHVLVTDLEGHKKQVDALTIPSPVSQ